MKKKEKLSSSASYPVLILAVSNFSFQKARVLRKSQRQKTPRSGGKTRGQKQKEIKKYVENNKKKLRVVSRATQ